MGLIETYKNEISKYSLLSHSESCELFKKAREGDKSAKEKIYASNLRLVINIAAKSGYHSEDDLLDNIQEGNIGLERAINRFNPSLNYKFSTYATYWIKAYIKKAIYQKKKTQKNVIALSQTEESNELVPAIKDDKIPNPEEELVLSQRSEYLAKALNTLSLEDRLLIKIRYGINEGQNYNPELTSKECGSIFKLTKQAISRREHIILKNCVISLLRIQSK